MKIFLWLLLFLFLCGCGTSGVYHQVRQGQTLYRIGKVYGVSAAEIQRANGIARPSQLRAGSRIYIPGATVKRRVPVTAKKPVVARKKKSPPVTVSRKKSAPETKSVTRKIQKAAPRLKPAAPKATADPAVASKAAKKGLLAWPLKGKIYRSFSTKEGGATGLEIAVRSGTAVNAAAPGRVIYSDNGIPGFGHLVIVQHDSNLFTIYGFNQQNLVKSGSYVSQGQRLALSGRPSKGGPSRLHFEVRQGKKPVNPILYLP